MQRVLDVVRSEMARYGETPLFDFWRDPAITSERKLAFAPHVAHFVMSFGDLCALALPEHPPADRYQVAVNQHAKEDAGHWHWYLRDLTTLGIDHTMRFSDAIHRIWNPATDDLRRVSYHLVRYALAGDGLTRLVLVECIEGAFEVTIAGLLVPARELEARTGQRLFYLGRGHADSEDAHELREAANRAPMFQRTLSDEQAAPLIAMVHDVFTHFRAFAASLLALAQRDA